MLKVKNVTKKFGHVTAVEDLSFTLDKGDVAGLLGPNGAGKTTTMRMIASYYFPTAGNIIVNNIDTQEFTQKTQKNIGYLPENNPLYLDMLVYDYLLMTARFYGVKKEKCKKAVEETAKAVDIYKKLGTHINELSKGYKQRVGIAAAIIHEPLLIILDEPTEGLDPIQREEIRKLIKGLAKDKAILISTHVMQEVKAMCNKVVIINDGKLVKEGDIDSLSSAKTLLLRIKGEKIKEGIEKFKEKEGLKAKVKEEKDSYKVELTSESDIRSKLSDTALRNNWTILEMQYEDELEEIFKKLK